MEKKPLLDLMSQQIAAQRQEILAAARDEATQIQQGAQQRAEQRRTDTLGAVESELDSLAARSRERVEAEAHMVTLTTKDTITNEVLAAVSSELATRSTSAEFPAILDALLAELMADSPSDVVVLAPEAHVEHCKRWLESHGHADLSVEPLSGLADGVAIQDRDRKFRYTNTLSARFRLQEGALRKHALNRLFPDSNSGGEG
jgi:vacuolar-type H+-ATPase subunit E/Vma4